jgi:hypothetical protein
MRAGFGRARHRSPAKNAATRMRMSSTLHRCGRWPKHLSLVAGLRLVAGPRSSVRRGSRQAPLVRPDALSIATNDGLWRAAPCRRRRCSAHCRRFFNEHAVPFIPRRRAAGGDLQQPQADHPLRPESRENRIECQSDPRSGHSSVRCGPSNGMSSPALRPVWLRFQRWRQCDAGRRQARSSSCSFTTRSCCSRALLMRY